MTSTETFSTLLRHPNDVIDQLESGAVVLTRRDGQPLRLSLDHNATRDHEMVLAVAQLMAPLLAASATDLVEKTLLLPFPWVEFLPAQYRAEFLDEFVRTATASASVGRFDRLSIVVANWRETATAYSLGLDAANTDLDHLTETETIADPRDQ